MKKLILDNERKVQNDKQKRMPEEDRVVFDPTKINFEQFVPDKKYLIGFSLVPSQAINCAEKMSFISTSDACHITYKDINGINMYTTCHDANYQVNPMIASYSLFEESTTTQNRHNEVDAQIFSNRNTPDHVHISDGDKGGYASYKEVFTVIKPENVDEKSNDRELHKSFFYCTNHAAQTVKKKIKSAGEEFNILKRMRSREKIIDRLNKPENTKLKDQIQNRSLEQSLPAFQDQIWDKNTTQNVELQNKLQNDEGARHGGHHQRVRNMLMSMINRWIRNKKNADKCKSILVPKMELEKQRLISKINSYFSFSRNPRNNMKGVVFLFTGVKDMQKSQDRFEVELFPERSKMTTMGGQCSCLKPQQDRVPCVHLIFYARSVQYPLNKLFRNEHSADYWRWQYEGMGEGWEIPDDASLESTSVLAAPVIGAPLRGRPKKGKRKKSFFEMKRKRMK